MQRKTICTRACSFCLFRSIDSYSDQNSWISQPFWQKKMKASKLPPIWALNLSIKKNESFKITSYLSTLFSNSNHSLNLSINVSIDQCWILFPTINVNFSFVKAKQMENVMAKKLFCTECSRILSQPLKKKKSKRMQRKTICTRACSFCLFRSIDSYSNQNSWFSHPISARRAESFSTDEASKFLTSDDLCPTYDVRRYRRTTYSSKGPTIWALVFLKFKMTFLIIFSDQW